MSLFYSYIAGSLHVSGPQAHLQKSSYSCSKNHWFSFCAALFACSVCSERHRNWTNGCVNSCKNSPEDGPVGPKHVENRQYMNKIEIVTSVGFYFICWKDARYKKLTHIPIWPGKDHNRVYFPKLHRCSSMFCCFEVIHCLKIWLGSIYIVNIRTVVKRLTKYS